MKEKEKKAIDWITEHKNIIFFIAVSVFALIIRLYGIKFTDGDMKNFLLPWYKEIVANGKIKALSHQVGNYNILYQTIIALMSYLPFRPLYCYKTLSIIFDYLLAFTAADCISAWKNTKRFEAAFNCIYAFVLCLPTVFINSSVWGQCDAMYTFLILLSVKFLYRQRYLKAFIFFGIALSLKLQTIFFIPFFYAVYLYRKNFTIAHLFLPFFVLWLSGIPGYLAGRKLTETFEIYISQTVEYPRMWLNFPSFWMLVGNVFGIMAKPAIIIVIILCGAGFYFILEDRKKLDTPYTFLNTAVWFLWTILLFLPSMHERYAYPLDILLLMICFFDKNLIIFSAGSIIISTITTSDFLFASGKAIQSRAFPISYLLLYIGFTYYIITNEMKSSGCHMLKE